MLQAGDLTKSWRTCVSLEMLHLVAVYWWNIAISTMLMTINLFTVLSFLFFLVRVDVRFTLCIINIRVCWCCCQLRVVVRGTLTRVHRDCFDGAGGFSFGEGCVSCDEGKGGGGKACCVTLAYDHRACVCVYACDGRIRWQIAVHCTWSWTAAYFVMQLMTRWAHRKPFNGLQKL